MLKHIVSSFNYAFKQTHKTILVGGAEEPLYRPSELGSDYSIVYFKEDFVASALHEIAHWCLAGSERRKRVDYGYWYEAKRDEKAQNKFEELEIKPQSVEWILSNAAGVSFCVSADNLSLKKHCHNPFKEKVRLEAKNYLLSGLPKRVSQIAGLLSQNDDAYLSLHQYKDLPG